jgi:hypothetical protein
MTDLDSEWDDAQLFVCRTEGGPLEVITPKQLFAWIDGGWMPAGVGVGVQWKDNVPKEAWVFDFHLLKHGERITRNNRRDSREGMWRNWRHT